MALRAICALLLLFAAAMKWEQLPGIGWLGEGLLHQPILIVGLIVFETLFAAWLLIGIWPGWSRWIPAVCFAGFSLVALYQALSGADSCGCFGRVKVDPWFTFSMDVAFAVALAIWPPGSHRRGAGDSANLSGLRWRVGAMVCIVPIVIGLTLWRLPGRVVAEGEDGLLRAGSLVILEPGKWIGKPFVLTKHIDIGDRLSRGEWIVVLYSSACGSCQRTVPMYEQLAAEHSRRDDAPRVALVEMPPYGEPSRPGERESAAVFGRLADAAEWFASTPVVLQLSEGIVTLALDGKAAEEFQPD